MDHDSNQRTALPNPIFSQRWQWASQQAISFLMQQAVDNPDCLSLAAGLVDPGTLPVEMVGEITHELFGNPDAARRALQYGTTAGADSLRAELVRHFARLEQSPVEQLGISADQIVATTGSQQMLSLVSEVLIDPGDICLVAAPTYFVYLGVLNGVGARTITVATDEHGMIPESLDEILSELDTAGMLRRVKLLYLVTYYENPSGVSLAPERRRKMVEITRKWSRDHRIYILEDTAYRELRYDGPEYHSVWSCDETRESVIVAQTFSKSFSPGLRVGYGVLPRSLVRPVCDRKGNEDFGSAHLNQQILAAALSSGRYPEHVARVCESYRAKRDAMLEALDEHMSDMAGVHWVHPHGGLYVWLTLPETIQTGFDTRLFQNAVHEHQVMYVPGELCFVGDDGRSHSNHMRLSFGVLSPDQLREGIRRLSVAVQSELQSCGVAVS